MSARVPFIRTLTSVTHPRLTSEDGSISWILFCSSCVPVMYVMSAVALVIQQVVQGGLKIIKKLWRFLDFPNDGYSWLQPSMIFHGLKMKTFMRIYLSVRPTWKFCISNGGEPNTYKSTLELLTQISRKWT